MEDRDREQLLHFVVLLREDLPTIFDASAPFMTPAVAERLWPAWEEILERDELGMLRAAIESGRQDDELDGAGLSGSELDYKLTGVQAARDAALAEPAPRPRLLKRWLKWIDVVLGSLVAALGAGEAIKELKEGVEAELEPHD